VRARGSGGSAMSPQAVRLHGRTLPEALEADPVVVGVRLEQGEARHFFRGHSNKGHEGSHR